MNGKAIIKTLEWRFYYMSKHDVRLMGLSPPSACATEQRSQERGSGTSQV